MNSGKRLVARSGLKPFGMLISCLLLFVVIAGRVTHGVVSGAVAKPREPLVSKTHTDPKWDLLDREGRVLATDARWLELSMSPRAMWQGHTPARIARGLNDCFEPEHRIGGESMLDRMLPDANSGAIQVRLFSNSSDGEERIERFLDASAIRRLDDWLITGEEGVPVSGMWLQLAGSEGQYRICWMPELLLNETTREAQGFRKERRNGESYIDRPSAWCRRIAARLAPCVGKGGLDPQEAREEVWKLLIPDPYEVVFDRISIAEGKRINEFLRAEGVSEGQMKLSWYRERSYPMTGGLGLEDGYAWLGPWRYRDLADCERVVLARHGLSSMPGRESDRRDALEREVREEATRRAPMTRLEASCEELFTQEEFASFLAKPAAYSFLAYHPARASSQRFFYGASDEDETPRVNTTIDAELQNFLHRRLFGTMVEHDAALAMGIVVDVNTGEVLAIDGVSQYELEMFLPLQYGYTPGSTFKPITATAALHREVVSPDQRFRTFNRSIHLGQFVKGSNRTIGEARNSELGVNGRLSLREGLAHSINAVMVQVGLKMSIENHRSTLIELGYGQSRQTELGMVAAGMVPPLKEWKKRYSPQASISMGHQIQCTLWQHTEGLLTIIRGGERLPLRVLRSVECREKVRAVSAMPPRTVFTNAPCEEVRGMMRLAAQIGTGERLYEELLAKGISLVWGGKTGTTHKPDKTACAHIELACAEENVERRRNGQPLLNCTKEGSVGTPPHSRDCYTASMMAFGSVGDPRGSLPLAGEEHEVMVFIVVEEPRGSKYYGSQIAGPTTMAVLREALKLTRDGQSLVTSHPSDPFTLSVPKAITQELSEDPAHEIPSEDRESGR